VENFKFTAFLVKFTPFLRVSDYMQIKFECVCPTIYILYNFFQIYHNFINNFSSRHQGGGADTLKFNLHIIGRAKKGCEFNQKRCELKSLLNCFVNNHPAFFPSLPFSPPNPPKKKRKGYTNYTPKKGSQMINVGTHQGCNKQNGNWTISFICFC